MSAPSLDPSAFAPILDDLGLALSAFGSANGDASLLLAAPAGERPDPAKHACLSALEGLGEHGACLLYLEGNPGEAELAAWRNALWPLLHVGTVYRLDPSGVTRRTLGGKQRVADASQHTGTVLVGRPTQHVMSPDATVEKFDLNATGWDGEPGGPGYPHFRWMRKYVGCFATAAPGARILDFGCGAGWVGIEAAKRIEGSSLCSFDPSPEMVRITGDNARAAGIEFTGRTGFGEDPPFPAEGEEPFDLVISSGVVSFSPDVEAWMDGLARTVKPGGTLVCGDIHRDSRGFRGRRNAKALLPVREMNARTRTEIRTGLEKRGFTFELCSGYQLTYPIPQAMHLNETRLKGVLTWPLLLLNQACAGIDKATGSLAQNQFDSWVMRLKRAR
jgi:SAM-dependent methyltransferase